jgi:hypothetical protein
VIQGSFELAKQEGTSSPPTWITVSIQGDSSNGCTVRVYERRAGCEGGTLFNARRSSGPRDRVGDCSRPGDLLQSDHQRKEVVLT